MDGPYNSHAIACIFSALYVFSRQPCSENCSSHSDRSSRTHFSRPQRSYHRRRRCMACLTLFTLPATATTSPSDAAAERPFFATCEGNFVIESWQLPRSMQFCRRKCKDKRNAREVILGSNKILWILHGYWDYLNSLILKTPV